MMDNFGEKFSQRLRKSAKSANRRTLSNETILSPFISGVRRDIYYQKETTNIIHTRSTYVKHLVKETLEDFSSLGIETKNPLNNIGSKLFLGECDFDDDFVQFPPNARVWKYPKTGRKVSTINSIRE